MKKRWMKSVLDASKQDIPAMPWQRDARCKRCGTCEAQPQRKSA